MNDYRQLAVRYLKQNRKRTIITIAGTAFMVMILFTVLNLAWGALLAHRDSIREEKDYEIVLFTESQEQIEQIIADERIKSAYVGTFYDKWEDAYYYNALYINVNNPYRINKLSEDFEQRYGVESDIHDELAWTYIQGSEGSEIVVLIFFTMLVVYIMTIFGVGIIRNSIQLSMLENIKDYGNMRCIGVSNSQLRTIIFLQGFLVETIGILLGSVIGTLCSLAISILCKQALDMSVYGGFHMLPFLLVYGAYLFDLHFSMMDNAKLVTRMTPVSAIRGEYRIRKEKIKIRDRNIFKKMLGVDGDYAYKNVLRNPGRFWRTVGALAFGAAALMMVMGTESSIIQFKKEQLKSYKYYQFFFSNDLGVDETIDQVESTLPSIELLEKFSKSREVSEVKQQYGITALTTGPDILGAHFTEEYKTQVHEGRYHWELYEKYTKKAEEQPDDIGLLSTKMCHSVMCYGYEDADLKRYQSALEEGTVDLSDHGVILVNGAKLMDTDYSGEYEIKKVTLTDYKVGDTIELINFAELNRRMVEETERLSEEYAGIEDEELLSEMRLKEGIALRTIMQEMTEQGNTTTYTIEGIVSDDVNIYHSQYMELYPIRLIMKMDSWEELSGLDETRPTGMLYHFEEYPESIMFFNAVSEWISLWINDEEECASVSQFIELYYEMQIMEGVIIFGGVVAGVILIMVILNLVNTMASSLHLRRKEFAQLRVIGVSRKHLIRMVLLEGIITAMIANVIGILLGILLLLVLSPTIQYMTGIEFHFPWMAVVIAILSTTAILCGAIYVPLRTLPDDMASDLKSGGD